MFIGLTIKPGYKPTKVDVAYLKANGLDYDESKRLVYCTLTSNNLQLYELQRAKNALLRVPNLEFYRSMNNDFGFHK